MLTKCSGIWLFWSMLVGSGCHNKVPQLTGFSTQAFIFPWFWRPKAKIKVPAGWLLLSSLGLQTVSRLLAVPSPSFL